MLAQVTPGTGRGEAIPYACSYHPREYLMGQMKAPPQGLTTVAVQKMSLQQMEGVQGTRHASPIVRFSLSHVLRSSRLS